MLNKINHGGRTMARTIGNVCIMRSLIVLTAIIIVITIASCPEFLLFKAYCPIGFGEVKAPGNNEIFKLKSKSGFPNHVIQEWN